MYVKESFMSIIDFNCINNIKADCILNFGAECRISMALKRQELRYFSSPFDWVRNYDLDVVIKLLRNKGDKFFADCYEHETLKNKYKRIIIDRATGMMSVHDYPIELSMDNAPEFYKAKFTKRFKRLHQELLLAKQPCFILYGIKDIEIIENFISQIKMLYNFSYIYIVNAVDDNQEYCEYTKLTDADVYSFYFNDEHENGRDRNLNPDYWLGNIAYWDKILSKLSLNK